MFCLCSFQLLETEKLVFVKLFRNVGFTLFCCKSIFRVSWRFNEIIWLEYRQFDKWKRNLIGCFCLKISAKTNRIERRLSPPVPWEKYVQNSYVSFILRIWFSQVLTECENFFPEVFILQNFGCRYQVYNFFRKIGSSTCVTNIESFETTFSKSFWNLKKTKA